MAAGNSKKAPTRPRTLRSKDKVLIVSGVAAGKIGVIRSIDHDRPPELRYFVMSANNNNEDKTVMGRFSSAELERIL